MPDKIYNMNQRQLVTRVFMNVVCDECDQEVRADLKERHLRYQMNAKGEMLVPYYWLHRECPHAKEPLFKSVWEGVGKDSPRSSLDG